MACRGLQARHLGEGYAPVAVECRAQVGVWAAELVALGLTVRSGSWGQGELGRIDLGVEACQELFALLVTCGKEGLIGAVSGEGLRPGKELLFSPSPDAGFSKGLGRGSEAEGAQLGQFVRSAFPGAEGSQDSTTGLAGEIADDVVQWEIPLGQCLLPMLDMGSRVGDQRITMAEQGAQGTDGLRRAKGGAQESHGV